MTLQQRLEALRLLRDLHLDIFNAQTRPQDTFISGPAISAFVSGAKALIVQTEELLKANSP